MFLNHYPVREGEYFTLLFINYWIIKTNGTYCSLVRRNDRLSAAAYLTSMSTEPAGQSRAITNGHTRISARTSHAILSTVSPKYYCDEVHGGNLSTNPSTGHKLNLQ